MAEDLSIDFVIRAQTRIAAREGVPITVTRRGYDSSGTMLLKINRLDGTARVLSQVRFDNELVWSPVSRTDPMNEKDADAYLAKQAEVDPDVWVIEIEDKKGPPLVPGESRDMKTGGMKNSGKKNELGGIASKRMASVRVKAKKNRTESSRKWLLRQLNDPYVAAAKEDGYRSRAAYKLLQLDEQFKLLKPGQRIVDLGAAPGGWSQVAVAVMGGKGKLIGIDLLPIQPMKNAEFIELDFLLPEAPGTLKDMLQGEADLVLSDLAHATTGHAKTDHIRVMALAEAAAMFAMEVLAPGGSFVCKFFQGGAEKHLLDQLKKNFARVKHAKPDASRKESSENYLVATGFRK